MGLPSLPLWPPAVPTPVHCDDITIFSYFSDYFPLIFFDFLTRFDAPEWSRIPNDDSRRLRTISDPPDDMQDSGRFAIVIDWLLFSHRTRYRFVVLSLHFRFALWALFVLFRYVFRCFAFHIARSGLHEWCSLFPCSCSTSPMTRFPVFGVGPNPRTPVVWQSYVAFWFYVFRSHANAKSVPHSTIYAFVTPESMCPALGQLWASPIAWSWPLLCHPTLKMCPLSSSYPI